MESEERERQELLAERAALEAEAVVLRAGLAIVRAENAIMRRQGTPLMRVKWRLREWFVDPWRPGLRRRDFRP